MMPEDLSTSTEDLDVPTLISGASYTSEQEENIRAIGAPFFTGAGTGRMEEPHRE